MNSFIVTGSLMFCLSCMCRVLDYEGYHARTITMLIKTTQEQYRQEGLRATERAVERYERSCSPISLVSNGEVSPIQGIRRSDIR